MNSLQRRICTTLGLGDLVDHLDELVTESARRELEWWRAGRDPGPPDDEISADIAAELEPRVWRETLLSRAVALIAPTRSSSGPTTPASS